MKYPTPGAYQEALQFPDTAFLDPSLQEAVPEMTVLGLPRVVTGAFAAVFPVQCGGARWAVKCFLTEVEDQKARYRAIARHLERHDLPYLIPFEYQARGIRVDGQVYPILKMAWVEGVALNRFVADHTDQPDVLADLAAQWMQMQADLEAAGIAHGDLQHGNVLVTEQDGAYRLKLIDYDTMYVPALKGRRSPEIGHRNYQHPDRDETSFGPRLDRFSSLAIYTALKACSEQPELWAQYDTDESMLFSAADFYDPSRSVLFEVLRRVEPAAPLVDVLQRACYGAPDSVPSLEKAQTGQARVMPQLSGIRRRVRREERGRRDTLERFFLPVLVAGIVLAGILFAVGGPYAGALLTLVVLLGAGGASLYGYRRLSVVRRRRRLQREAAYFDGFLERLRQQVASLEQERRSFTENQASLHRERLREVQEQALEERLKYHFIDEARRVAGVTHKVVVRLKAAGVRTAFQAVPGRLAKAREVGEKSRARITAWREALVARYEHEIPAALSPAEERRFERYIGQRLQEIDAEIARAREKVAVQQAEQAQVEARQKELPPFAYGAYLRFLLRMGGSRPAGDAGRPAPLPTVPPAGEQQPAGAVPPPAEDDQPWWRSAK